MTRTELNATGTEPCTIGIEAFTLIRWHNGGLTITDGNAVDCLPLPWCLRRQNVIIFYYYYYYFIHESITCPAAWLIWGYKFFFCYGVLRFLKFRKLFKSPCGKGLHLRLLCWYAQVIEQLAVLYFLCRMYFLIINFIH